MHHKENGWLIHGVHCLSAMQTFDQEEDLYDEDQVRHAETPELAREALIDSAVLIYKSQIEVAFREQTAGHNALLLFVGLALQLMEEQLYNAFKELDAKEAEVGLLAWNWLLSSRSDAECWPCRGLALLSTMYGNIAKQSIVS